MIAYVTETATRTRILRRVRWERHRDFAIYTDRELALHEASDAFGYRTLIHHTGGIDPTVELHVASDRQGHPIWRIVGITIDERVHHPVP